MLPNSFLWAIEELHDSVTTEQLEYFPSIVLNHTWSTLLVLFLYDLIGLQEASSLSKNS